MRFIGGLQYRAAALAGIATQFGFGYLMISQFLAFYRSNPEAFPMEVPHLVSYIWVQQAFIALFFSWFFENSIFASITSGQISYDLARPMDLYWKWFSENVAGRLSRAALRCFPILIIAIFLPHPYKLILPPDALQLLLFVASSALALCVVVSFSMFIYISTFYTLSPLGMRIIAAVFADFLAGSTIPLPFFPERLRQIVQILPFAAMQNVPLRIYSGNISGFNAFINIMVQVFWLIVLSFLGKIWMNATLKRVVVQGG